MIGEYLSILNNYNQPFYGCPVLLHSLFGPTTINLYGLIEDNQQQINVCGLLRKPSSPKGPS